MCIISTVYILHCFHNIYFHKVQPENDGRFYPNIFIYQSLKFSSYRIKNGRDSVEPGYREHQVEKKKLFKPYFTVEPIAYQNTAEKTFFPTDILGFRDHVFQILGFEKDDPEVVTKLGIDKGKHFLKVAIKF